MKRSGRCDFLFKAPFTRYEAVVLMNHVLNEFLEREPEVISVQANLKVLTLCASGLWPVSTRS
jgi:hypothetical protein